MVLLSSQMKWTMAHLKKSQPPSVDTALKSDSSCKVVCTKVVKSSSTAAVHCFQSTLLCFPTQIKSLLISIVSLFNILGSPGILLG